MKENRSRKENEDVKSEYDFSGGVRGKYAKRFTEGTNIVVLEPDVAEMFPDSSSVNEALRALVRIARRENRNEVGPS
jgi:hypothetical protein